MNTRNEKHTHTPWGGIILIAVGILFLLDSLDFLNFGNLVSNWWPLIIIFIGFFKLKGEQKTSGAIVFIIGVALLTHTLGVIQWGNVFRFWPLILIMIGLSVIAKSRNKPGWKFMRSGKSSDNYLKTSVIFGGSSLRVESTDFHGGDVMALFGGIELDLRDVTVSGDGAVVQLTALFGGIEVRVPSDCRVAVNGTPILGGVDNQTRSPENDDASVIRFNCTVAFGGIEIRN